MKLRIVVNSRAYANISFFIEEVLRTQCGNSSEMCYVGSKILKWYNFNHPVRLLRLDGNFFLRLGEESDIWIADPWNSSFYKGTQRNTKMKLYTESETGASILPLPDYLERYPESKFITLSDRKLKNNNTGI